MISSRVWVCACEEYSGLVCESVCMRRIFQSRVWRVCACEEYSSLVCGECVYAKNIPVSCVRVCACKEYSGLVCESVCMQRIFQSRVWECVHAKNILVSCVRVCACEECSGLVCECVHAKNVQSIWLCEPQGGYLSYRQCTETVVKCADRQQGGWQEAKKVASLIGASVSEPHTSLFNCDFSWYIIIIYILSVVCRAVYPWRCNLMQ